ncbi:hypothetical protein [Streptomyces sp. NPDC057686]|uniref:hypothetical protein n=1 Tax=Streptomyces sp. NPDC057686 TaxID=3346212 RepID=UPI0036C65034
MDDTDFPRDGRSLPGVARRMPCVGGTTRRNSTHNSSGTSRSTRPAMRGSTNSHEQERCLRRSPLPPLISPYCPSERKGVACSTLVWGGWFGRQGGAARLK